MVSESEVRRREQLAAEMILQGESLTDEEARSALEAGVSWVQWVMKTINWLVGERYEMDDEEMLEELLSLVSLVEEKPTPSG